MKKCVQFVILFSYSFGVIHGYRELIFPYLANFSKRIDFWKKLHCTREPENSEEKQKSKEEFQVFSLHSSYQGLERFWVADMKLYELSNVRTPESKNSPLWEVDYYYSDDADITIGTNFATRNRKDWVQLEKFYPKGSDYTRDCYYRKNSFNSSKSFAGTKPYKHEYPTGSVMEVVIELHKRELAVVHLVIDGKDQICNGSYYDPRNDEVIVELNIPVSRVVDVSVFVDVNKF